VIGKMTVTLVSGNGDARFILQNFHDEAFAQNLMIRIDVPDLEAWCKPCRGKNLEKSTLDSGSILRRTSWGRESISSTWPAYAGTSGGP